MASKTTTGPPPPNLNPSNSTTALQSSRAERAASAKPSPSTSPPSVQKSSSATFPAPKKTELIVSEINSKFAHACAIYVKADVSDPVQVKSLFDKAESAFNYSIHIVVNAAGIKDSSDSSIPNSSVDLFDRTIAVNTRGSYLVCKEAANRLKQGGGGRIVCVTSSLVVALRPGYGAYAASKAAVEAMVKILAKELKGTRITVNCVAPGPIATELFFKGKSEEMVKMAVERSPMGRLGQPEDVAQVVGFLVSDAGEWINGQVVRVNGGYI